jgi:hypothetical protein
MTGLRDKQYLSHALHQIMRDFYSLFQGKHHSNQNYYNEFNILVLLAEESGAKFGTHPGAVAEILANVADDPAHPTDAKRTEAIKSATNRYLAVAFLLGADRTRYGTMIAEIQNEYLRNRDSTSTIGT